MPSGSDKVCQTRNNYLNIQPVSSSLTKHTLFVGMSCSQRVRTHLYSEGRVRQAGRERKTVLNELDETYACVCTMGGHG
jgi:hypothetical protein